MKVDPHGWLVTLPLFAALLWLYCQPTHHILKQAWRELMRHEARAMAQVAGVEACPDSPARSLIEWLLFRVALIVLGIGSAASLAAYLGVLPAA